jgi:hypothetical protein
MFDIPGLHNEVRCDVRPNSSFFPPYPEAYVTLWHVFHVAREVDPVRNAVSAGSMPFGIESKMADCVIITMICSCR